MTPNAVVVYRYPAILPEMTILCQGFTYRLYVQCMLFTEWLTVSPQLLLKNHAK